MITILRLDSGYSVHLQTRLTDHRSNVAVLASDTMIAGISARILLSLQRAMHTSQPHSPRNSHNEPAARPRIRTGLVKHRLRTRVSQQFLLLPRSTRPRVSSGRAGPESTPVGRLLIRLIRVPQSSLVFRGPREMYRKPLRILRAPRPQFDNLMPSTPQPGQPVDPQMAISLRQA